MNINNTWIAPNQLLSRFGIPIKQAKEASLGTPFLHLHFSFSYLRQNTRTSTHIVLSVKLNAFPQLGSFNSRTQICSPKKSINILNETSNRKQLIEILPGFSSPFSKSKSSLLHENQKTQLP